MNQISEFVRAPNCLIVIFVLMVAGRGSSSHRKRAHQSSKGGWQHDRTVNPRIGLR